MAMNKGQQYERNVVRYLRKNFKLSDGTVAGASSARPDMWITYGKMKAGCELKVSDSSGGSLVIKYYLHKTPHFQFSEDIKDPEKVFLRDLATDAGMLKEINRNWKQPFIIEDRDAETEKQMLAVPLSTRYKSDLKSCPDFRLTAPSSAMSDYYAKKNTHYINIGTKGFYVFSDKDPLELNSKLGVAGMALVPRFQNCVDIVGRARVQSKSMTRALEQETRTQSIGGQGYQLTFELQFRVKTPSPYNLAPCTVDDVRIIGSKVNVSCLLV